MSKITEHIMETVRNSAEGTVISPKEFIHLGSRAAIDQAFSRLTKAGLLLRISRGLYTAPIKGKFGERPPAAQLVIKSIETRRGERLVSTGASAANALGFTTQTPTREILLTAGRPYAITLGKRQIEIRHAPRWQLVLPDTTSGLALRAIAWQGEESANETAEKLRNKLSSEDWRELQLVRARLPGWVAKCISESRGG